MTANLQSEVPLAIYAYPFSFHDITFSSGIAVPIVWADVKANATYNRNNVQVSGTKEQSVSGLGDIQLMPVMAAWTNGDFKIGGMLNVWAPSGDYTTGQLANPGMGYWTFDPMLAFSWLSSKIGTEFSVFAGLDFNTENTDASYHSGDIFHLDATLAQHLPVFGGIAGAGASAFYLKQITGDSGSGANLGSFNLNPMALDRRFLTFIPSANPPWSWMGRGCRSCTATTPPRATIGGSAHAGVLGDATARKQLPVRRRHNKSYQDT